jgi:N4-(beta-N-acetylglucosaminyl)-L-asparaginase
MNRRKFINLTALTAPLFSFTKFNETTPVVKPVMISTWEEGKKVNNAAWGILSKKGKAIDAIEAGALYVEDKISCCVGLGGNPDRDGMVTLDACIMDEKANCGAVAGLERIKHPLSVARKVMETTPHVLLVGDGALKFALQNGFAIESKELSADAKKEYEKWLKKSAYKPVINIENQPDTGDNKDGAFAMPMKFDDGSFNHDTMGMIAIDAAGNISGGVTTSGMAFKMHGRVGDSAVIGAGLFVDNEVGAATSSGVGEEVIRTCGTHTVVEFMRRGFSPEMACKKTVERIIKNDKAKAKTLQVGFVAVNKKGEYGAYALQEGFVYAVKTNQVDKIFKSAFFYKAPKTEE